MTNEKWYKSNDCSKYFILILFEKLTSDISLIKYIFEQYIKICTKNNLIAQKMSDIDKKY